MTRQHAESITCPVCGMTSYNFTDVAEGYCGHCHDWTSVPGGLGDCFPTAGRLVSTGRFRDDPTAFLCHGIAVGTGEENLGQRFWHAWVEFEERVDFPLPDGTTRTTHLDMVVDESNGNDMTLPRALFYKVGNIDPEFVWRYPAAEVAAKMLREGHWGPWEEVAGDIL